MVASLDGFIASHDGDMSWFQTDDHYEKGITLTEEDILAFNKEIDCYLMGSKTYEQALSLGWPYGDTPVIVLTKRKLPRYKDSVSFFQGNTLNLINEDIKDNYQNIWLVGGAAVAKDFLEKDLLDRIVISFLPVLLGSGISFFGGLSSKMRLLLEDVKTYNDGMVEMSYAVKKIKN